MADGFKRPKKPEFEPREQDEVRAEFEEPQPELSDQTPAEGPSRAKLIIDSYDKSIEFMKWLEGLLDDELKDVVVEIDPEEQPEVWMAMQRIFNNPNPKITYGSYVQILQALEDVSNVEFDLENQFAAEDEFIEQIKELSFEEPETDTPEMDVPGEDEAALDQATSIREFVGGEGIDQAKLKKAQAWLAELRQKYNWWRNWQNVWRLRSVKIYDDEDADDEYFKLLTRRRIELQSLATRIQKLGKAIDKATNWREPEELYALLETVE